MVPNDQDNREAWTLKSGAVVHFCLHLRIRLTPKSSRDAIDGVIDTNDGPAIKARVRAVPENEKANKALIALVAKWLSLPKSGISLSAGGKSRLKVLSIIADDASGIERIKACIEMLSRD